jgi:NAD(P)-dependent dehydrogenase (short-subunit alcohol dehydrogenase family)
VNSVAPGVIRTRFQEALTPEQVRKNVENRILLRREGKPEDVQPQSLCSSRTTSSLAKNGAIDGGMTMRIA